MKKSKGFSAKIKDRMWALYVVHGTKWTAILNDLTNEQRDGKISRTARIPADERTIKSYIEAREKRENAPSFDTIYSDPLIVKAREEHLSEIRALIDNLRNVQQLAFMEHTQPYDNSKDDDQPTKMEALENEPLYASLKEHIPISAFWEDYSIWRASWASYIYECNQFWHFVGKEVNEVKEWPGVLRIYYKDMYSSIEKIILDRNRKPIEFSKSFSQSKGGLQTTILANGKAVLTTTIDAVIYTAKYSGIVQLIMNSAELESVRERYKEAVEAKNKVDRALDEILLGHKYIVHTCRLCPGQPY